MKKRLLSWLLVLTMITSLIPSTLITSALAAALPSRYDAVYNAENLDPATSFENGKTYRLTGTGNVPVKISAGRTVTIVLDGVTINSTNSPIQVETGATLTLITKSNTVNTLTCTSNTVQSVTDNNASGLTAGISVPDGATLIIDGNGTLTVNGGYGGAGIGGSYTATYGERQSDGGTGGTGEEGNGSGGTTTWSHYNWVTGGAGGQGGSGGQGGRNGSSANDAGTITIKSGVVQANGGTQPVLAAAAGKMAKQVHRETRV